MNAVELKYATLTGEMTAFVFVGDDGLVVSEKGLSELVTALRDRKRVSARADDLSSFLDLSKSCPNPAWENLRAAYAAELEASASCTTCVKKSVARKYVKIINSLSSS